jgi:hypothetical protein
MPPPSEGAAEDGGTADRGAPACPSCGGLDLRPERSSHLVLGVLPVSRRGFRCAGCGSLWRLEEIHRPEPPEPRPAPWQEAGERAGRDPGLPEIDAGAAGDGGGYGGSEGEGEGEGEDTALSTVARFHTPWEAHLARTFLESEGLRCCVLEERLPAVRLLSAIPIAYNRVEVRLADAARAAEILARAWSYPSLVAIPDPDSTGSDADPDPDPDPDAGPGPDADAGPDGGFDAGAEVDGGQGSGADRRPGDPPAGR